MGRRKSCSPLPSLRRSPLFLARVVSSSSLFFPSILYFSFLSRLSSRSWCIWCISRLRMSVNTEREVSFAGSRYIYEEPPPLMVSMCSDAARTCPVHTRVRGAIPHACVRARVYTRVHVPIPRRAIQRVGKTRKDSPHTHIHTHEPHGRELCLARDVKLLAIS